MMKSKKAHGAKFMAPLFIRIGIVNFVFMSSLACHRFPLLPSSPIFPFMHALVSLPTGFFS